MQPITILIVTYDRPKEIRKTIQALQSMAYYPSLHWHIADDGTPGNYVHDIEHDFPHLTFTHTITRRKGWGVNVNTALKHLEKQRHNDYIFLIEDDYVATLPLNLLSGVKVLQNTDLLAIRYDGLSGHLGLNLSVREVKTDIGVIDYLDINPQQSGHFNVYSNRPHLRKPEFTAHYGYYVEGQKLGQTEVDFAGRVKADNRTTIGILETGITRHFEHIGKSRQHTELDI